MCENLGEKRPSFATRCFHFALVQWALLLAQGPVFHKVFMEIHLAVFLVKNKPRNAQIISSVEEFLRHNVTKSSPKAPHHLHLWVCGEINEMIKVGNTLLTFACPTARLRYGTETPWIDKATQFTHRKHRRRDENNAANLPMHTFVGFLALAPIKPLTT